MIVKGESLFPDSQSKGRPATLSQGGGRPLSVKGEASVIVKGEAWERGQCDSSPIIYELLPLR